MEIAAGLTVEDLWREAGFSPNDAQRAAILHVDGPLYLPAGPGSGKTRVLLWRTLNLCVFHGVQPEQIFLSTFTEKAAFQLKEGLRTLLGQVTNHTGAAVRQGCVGCSQSSFPLFGVGPSLIPPVFRQPSGYLEHLDREVIRRDRADDYHPAPRVRRP